MTAPDAADDGPPLPRFVTFEGIDGSGKSTQAGRLAERLRVRGVDVVATREPGGSPGAEEIRRLLVDGDEGRWSAESELLLFTAARRDHAERVIWPAMERGATVICDRFVDSTRAYQGAGRPDIAELCDRLHRLVVGTMPDLTLLIDIDPEAAARRLSARPGGEARFETRGLVFQAGVREAYRRIARAEPDRVRLIDGAMAEDAIAEAIAAELGRSAA